MTAESKRIAKGGADRALLCFIKCKVELGVQFRIVGKMIDRGWHHIVHHRLDSGNGLYYTRRTEAVTCHRLGSTDI